MRTSRVESFSDGVMAVAITLLILNFPVPSPRIHDLGHALGQQWPVYAAYAVSFTTIGIIWINHHIAIGRLARADHSILILNILLLAAIVVIPWSTSLLATYLKQGGGASLAAAVYGGTLLAMALGFAALHRQILFHRPHLLLDELTEAERRDIFRRSVIGVVPYVVATALAAVSPYTTLAITAAIAVYYALPRASAQPGRRERTAGG